MTENLILQRVTLNGNPKRLSKLIRAWIVRAKQLPETEVMMNW